MLGFVEIIFSSIGLYGFFSQNFICIIIGLVAIVICDCIDIFVTGHNPTTILLAIMLAIGASIASKNPLYSFTVAICGENFIMSVTTLIFMTITFAIGFFKAKKDIKIQKGKQEATNNTFYVDDSQYIKLSNIIMQGLGVDNIDEALEKSYEFYKEQGIDMSNINLENDNKYMTLSKMVMLGVGANTIEEAIERTSQYYQAQGIEKSK